MYVVAIHKISDPEKFWQAAQAANLPEGVWLRTTLPDPSGSRAVCVWEAESLDAVQRLVEDEVGQFSDKEYFELATENAFGFPAQG